MKTLSTQLFPNFGGVYTGLNTIVVDDNPLKHALNNPRNVILLDSWLKNSRGQSDNFLMDTLLPYLRHVHSRQNILLGRSEQPRIGQRMLIEDPNSIEYKEILAAIDLSVWV